VVARVGVATGEVVAQEPSDLIGEPLATATALAQAAGAGEVLLADATRRLADAAIDVEPVHDGAAWRLRSPMTPVPGAGRPRNDTPMIGRKADLRSARAAFEGTRTTQRAQLVTVVGDAGIGKSRLADELSSALGEQASVLTGRCLPYGDGIAFWPLREAIVQAAGSEAPAAIRSLVAGTTDAELVAEVAASALGLASPGSHDEQIPWAFVRLLEALARERPLIVVIDDAHWAQEPLLDIVDHLVDWLLAPVLLLCLGRPELIDRRPRWAGGHPRVSSLVLLPLSDGEARELLANLVGEPQLSSSVAARILGTAEGNPLFVEQLFAMSAEEPWWQQEQAIPATIQSLLAARLDRIGPGERMLIRIAAVMGREFWPQAVADLLAPEVRAAADAHLRALVRRGLIEPGRGAPPGREVVRFHHILIRDVAYRSTPKAQRAGLHERFADWLALREDGLDEFVGYHLEQAFGYRRELGDAEAEVRPLAARAAEALAIAGREAYARGDPNAAVKLLARTGELYRAAGGARPEVLLDLGAALSETGDFDGAEQALQTALEAAREAGEEAVGARAQIELSYRRALVDSRIDVGEMLAVAERSLEICRRVGDHGGQARAYIHIAEVHWTRCRCSEMERVLEEALTHAERAGDRRSCTRILSDLARATVIGPRPVAEGIERCQSIVQRAGTDIACGAVADTMLAVLEAMLGRFDEARQRWQRTKARLQEVGLSVTLAALQMYPAFTELLAGTPERAEAEVADGYVSLKRIGEQRRLATITALLARLLCAQQRWDEAELYTRLSEQAASRDDIVSQALWRGTRGRVLARAGDERAALELVDSACALVRETDFLMLQADMLLDRCEVLELLGRPSEAGDCLEQAASIYERKGVTARAGSWSPARC
jgi:tetratricopeptide (TPR) repeat protein